MIIMTACIKILLRWIIICFSRAGRTNEGNRLTLQTKSKEFQRLHIGHIQCERVCGLVVKIGCHESSLISSEFSSTVFARLQKVVTIFKWCFNQKLLSATLQLRCWSLFLGLCSLVVGAFLGPLLEVNVVGVEEDVLLASVIPRYIVVVIPERGG